MKTNDILKIGLAAFAFWYLTRRTDLGQEFIGDVGALPQQLGVAEGLKSAIQLTK